MFYQKSTLENGLRVVTEEIPHVRSASIGVWVGTGSCCEQPANMGISHFIEHMLFKGTANRSSLQLAQAIDGRGGSLNAFTAKEQTCYYARVLDQHVPVAVEVLADMFQHSLFDSAEIEKEKGVILEEIKMYEDVPDDLVHELFATALWREHALGRPIVGTGETVQSFSREQLLAYCQEHYVPDNVVVAAAGNIAHDQVVELVDRLFNKMPAPRQVRPDWPEPPHFDERGARALLRVKETEQTHLVVGMQALAHDHPDIYALHLISTVLGGGSSSRLFQEIREERGLAYSVFSYLTSFRQTGHFGVYAGVSPGVTGEVLALILANLRQVGKQSITATELDEAKEQVKGQLMLGLESTSGRMTRLGRGELTYNRTLAPDEIIARIDQVSAAQVLQLAHRLFIEEPLVASLVGTFSADLDIRSFGFKEVVYG